MLLDIYKDTMVIFRNCESSNSQCLKTYVKIK